MKSNEVTKFGQRQNPQKVNLYVTSSNQIRSLKSQQILIRGVHQQNLLHENIFHKGVEQPQKTFRNTKLAYQESKKYYPVQNFFANQSASRQGQGNLQVRLSDDLINNDMNKKINQMAQQIKKLKFFKKRSQDKFMQMEKKLFQINKRWSTTQKQLIQIRNSLVQIRNQLVQIRNQLVQTKQSLKQANKRWQIAQKQLQQSKKNSIRLENKFIRELELANLNWQNSQRKINNLNIRIESYQREIHDLKQLLKQSRQSNKQKFLQKQLQIKDYQIQVNKLKRLVEQVSLQLELVKKLKDQLNHNEKKSIKASKDQDQHFIKNNYQFLEFVDNRYSNFSVQNRHQHSQKHLKKIQQFQQKKLKQNFEYLEQKAKINQLYQKQQYKLKGNLQQQKRPL